MSNRAERRRAAHEARREPQHGAVYGQLDTGEVWSVLFPTTREAQTFLRLLGPPPATRARLNSAMRRLRGGENG
jgi:hypothetical protein